MARRIHVCYAYTAGATKLTAPPSTSPECVDHAPTPPGYANWHEWAEEMARTHRCRRCPGCGLFLVWTRVYTPPKEATNG